VTPVGHNWGHGQKFSRSQGGIQRMPPGVSPWESPAFRALWKIISEKFSSEKLNNDPRRPFQSNLENVSGDSQVTPGHHISCWVAAETFSLFFSLSMGQIRRLNLYCHQFPLEPFLNKFFSARLTFRFSHSKKNLLSDVIPLKRRDITLIELHLI
jgi:hypothetical protein